VKDKKRRRETIAIHGPHEMKAQSAPVAVPIYQSSTFQMADMGKQAEAEEQQMFYTRLGNPTHRAAEEVIATLEGAEEARLFASGMAAITGALLCLLKAGDHIVCQRDIYGGTSEFMHDWLPRFGVEVTYVDVTRPEEFEQAMRPATRLLYLESPTNPTLKICDLERVAAIARKRGLPTFLDSTFCSPINSRPIEFGIDVVLHSATKYMGGHSDIIAGVVASSSREFMKRLRESRLLLGAAMDPHASWLLLRGLKTLAVRVERQNQTALKVAEFLEKHPAVKRVHYPMLASHPQHALAKKQMAGGGGLLSFDVAGTGADARRLVEALRLFTLAPSLGGVESLATLPVMTSHMHISAEDREKTGVTETLVRLAIGLEAAEDLMEDLQQALEKAVAGRQSPAAG
jgi:cystathionine beta-lyase